jgi:hypothetical protein
MLKFTLQFWAQTAGYKSIIFSLKVIKKTTSYKKHTIMKNLGFEGPCIFTHSNESTNQMQQVLLAVVDRRQKNASNDMIHGSVMAGTTWKCSGIRVLHLERSFEWC